MAEVVTYSNWPIRLGYRNSGARIPSSRLLGDARTIMCLDVVAHKVSKLQFGREHIHKLAHKFTQLLILNASQILFRLTEVMALFCSRKRVKS